jgi:serine/threonine protein kinase/WD40 repeat protein
MTPEQYQQVQHAFLHIRDLASRDQHPALQELDERLRLEVVALLESDSSNGSFLELDSRSHQDTDETSAETGSFIDHSRSAPATIGRYRLLQRIGEGGQGSVYMAEQTGQIRRKVAIKLVKKGMDSKQVLARFHAEQQALAMMDHSSIAKVFDAGVTDDGAPYFVMELVKGVPIHTFCEQSHADLNDRLELFLQVCDAVHHAHRKGIIHRDIKPTNVLVTMGESDPIAKVIDFGIAKALDQKLTQQTLFTEYGQMIGTLEYMSPEQAEMSAVEIDTRSDVYSLGVLLYELLTGERPISREQLLSNGVFEIPRVLRETEPKTPSDRITSRQQQATMVDRDVAGLRSLPSGELDWIALKALAKDRRRRYESVLDLARDVRRFLGGEPVEAHPPSLIYRMGKMLRRHYVSFAMAGVLAAGAIVGLMGLGVGLTRANKAAAVARDERNAAIQAREGADASKRELGENVYSQLIQSAWTAANQQKVDAGRDLLQKCLPELRGWEWRLVNSQLREATALPDRDASISSIREFDLHSQSQCVACVNQAGTVEVWCYDLENERQFGRPLGESRAVSSTASVTPRRVPPTESLQLADLKFPERANVARWSSDGQALFVGTSSGTIYQVSVGEWEKRVSVQLAAGGVYDLATSHKGDQVAVCTGNGTAQLLDFDKGTRSWKKRGSWKIEPRLSAIAFAADDGQILAAGFDGNVYVIDPENDESTKRNADRPGIYQVCLLRDGKLAALATSSAIVMDQEGEPDRVIKIAARASSLATDGDSLLALGGGDGSLRMCHLDTVGEPIVVANFGSAITDMHWEPQSERFLVSCSDGRVLWVAPPDFDDSNRSPMATATSGSVLEKHGLIVVCDGRGTLRALDQSTGALVAERKVHRRSVWSLSMDRDQTILASVGEDRQLCCWELPEFKLRFSQKVAWGVRDVCVASDGSWIASAPDPDPENYPREGTVAIRDAQSGAAIQTLNGHENWVLKMATTSDSRTLITSGEFANSRVWDVATGRQLAKAAYGSRSAGPQLVFDETHDGFYLGHRDGWITHWLLDGTPLGSWPAFGDAISGLHLTADDRILATSRSSPNLKVFDFQRNRELATLDLGLGFILGFYVSEQDRSLSAIGASRQMRILEMADRAPDLASPRE